MKRTTSQHCNRRRFLGMAAGALAVSPTAVRAEEQDLPSCTRKEWHGPWYIEANSTDYAIERRVEARGESDLKIKSFDDTDDRDSNTSAAAIRVTDHGHRVDVEARIPKYLTGGNDNFRLDNYKEDRLMRIWTGLSKSAPLEAELSVDGREITRGPVNWTGMEPTKSVEVRFEWAKDPLPAMRSGRNAVITIRIGDSDRSGPPVLGLPVDLSGVVAATRIGQRLQQQADEESKARECSDDCYLTTACCEHFGRPDTCWELETLRWYRDRILVKQGDGPEALRLYYHTAPAIVAALPRRGLKRGVTLARIYWLTVIPCAILVRCRAYGLARQRYEKTFRRLRAGYLLT